MLSPILISNQVIISKSQQCDDISKYTFGTIHRNTKSVIKYEGKYIHVLEDNIYLQDLLCIHSYNVNVVSDKDTKIRLYTLMMGKLYWQTDNSEFGVSFASEQLIGGIAIKFSINSKCVIFVTERKCKLSIAIDTIKKISSLKIPHELIENSGHSVIHPTLNEELKKSIMEHYALHSISLINIENRINDKRSVERYSEKNVDIYGLEYYLYMSTILTITRNIKEEYRYPPYSIKLSSGQGIVTLIYRLSFNSDVDGVTITCIESLSKSTYAILRANDGKKLYKEHGNNIVNGRNIAEGSFRLPDSCLDVGLHLYSPYGFSVDIGDDLNKDAVKFEKLTLVYT